MPLKVVSCVSTEVWEFTHNDPALALAYVHAEKTNRMSHFFNRESAYTKAWVTPFLREGEYGYHLHDWSVPKSTIKESE